MHTRLKLARKKAGYSSARKFAITFEIPPSTYAGHENGDRAFSTDEAERYARRFGVKAAWLLFGGEMESVPVREADAHPDHELVSVYDVKASAGYGALVEDEYVVERLAFPPEYLRRITKTAPGNLAIIGVKGDSMMPTLKDDDLVMIDTSKRDLSWGGIFVMKVDGDGLLVKRVSMGSQRGFFKIVSDNSSAFPAVERQADELEVVGRVIWYGVKV